MPDVTDYDVITEEILGIAPGSSPIPTEEFTTASIPTETSPIVASSSTPKSTISAESDSDVTLDNLRAVSAQFDKGCVTLNQIVEGSGLTQSIVLACLKWLRDNDLMPMIAQTGNLYCSLDNVTALAEQLKKAMQ